VYFIDIAIPNIHNLHAKYAEKLAKYLELSTEIKNQWKMNTVATIPVTLSTNLIIPKTLHTQSHRTSKGYNFKYRQYSETVPQHLIKQHTCAILLTLRSYLVITRTVKYPENSQ
jgi:hypothetical protein